MPGGLRKALTLKLHKLTVRRHSREVGQIAMLLYCVKVLRRSNVCVIYISTLKTE